MWATPVASQQIVVMMLDMFMAGYRTYPPAPASDPYAENGQPYKPVALKPTEPARPILMYIMPHFVSSGASADPVLCSDPCSFAAGSLEIRRARGGDNSTGTWRTG